MSQIGSVLTLLNLQIFLECFLVAQIENQIIIIIIIIIIINFFLYFTLCVHLLAVFFLSSEW